MTNDERNPKGPKGAKSRSWIVWVTIFCGILLLMFLRDRWNNQGGSAISQYKFEQLLEDEQIAHATIVYDTQNSPLTEVVGQYLENQNGQKTVVPFRARIRLTGGLEQRLLGLPYVDVHQPNTMFMSVVWSILPIIVIAAFIWFFFIRQIKLAARGAGGRASLEERINKEVEQQERFDRILERWEQQADRMDKILERGEHQAAQGKNQGT
jgi:ATP-dependent Zn protease